MNSILSKLIFITATVIIILSLFSCTNGESKTNVTTAVDVENTDNATVAAVTDTQAAPEGTETEENSSIEEVTTVEEIETIGEITPLDYSEYNGKDGKTITASANLANSVNGYFPTSAREEYIMSNRNMKLVYGLGGNGYNSLRKLSDKNGNVYISDTMDTFIEKVNGNKYYAAGSAGRVNLYDQGFYFYNVHVLDQCFFAEENIVNKKVISPNKPSGINQLKQIKTAEGQRAFQITDVTDPYIMYQNINISADDYDAICLTMRTSVEDEVYVYYLSGDHTNLSQEQLLSFRAIADGEFHTYYINMRFRNDFTGNLSTLRFDFGAAVGQVIEISDISIIDYKADTPNIILDRNYCVYSDKLHEVVRYMAIGDLEKGSKLGTETKIPTEAVDKLIVTDKNGTHDSLDGIDWASAYCVGFDIKGTGVFGIILPDDKGSGQLYVKSENGQYIVTQTYTTEADMKNGDEHFIGRRIYTDTAHTFDGLGYEAFCERNPLTPEINSPNNVKVRINGYDVLRGAYVFEITSGTPDFMEAYNSPDKTYSYNITFTGDKSERQIYVSSNLYRNGFLECAALLDSDSKLMPVKMEVCKNFAPDGEEMFYTYNDSIAYSLVIFPLVIDKNASQSYTVCNLYERWGIFRLKQISSIRFHSAYYHLSTGTTESNCINFYSTNRLPDHRAMSMPYWADLMIEILNEKGQPTGQQRAFDMSPEHTNTGFLDYLRYTTADGQSHVIENIGNTVNSSGPVYTDITLNYVSDDRKIKQSYRHVEYCQIDENRAYYDIDLEFCGSVDINDVRNNLSLYSMKWAFNNLGYLDADNNSQIIKTKPTSSQFVTLGDNCPYFDYFTYSYANSKYLDESTNYCNLSCIVYDYDIMIGGQKYNGRLGVTEGGGKAFLTLDLDEAHFIKGDYIRLRVILMPWGYRESTDDINVRNARINTCLNPISIKETNGDKVEDRILNSVRSSDGKAVEFTVSGGYDNLGDTPGYTDEGETRIGIKIAKAYNVAARAYGFKSNTVPKIYENVGGNWIEYKVCSGAGYDGYSVFYDTDGTFSYAFNIDMSKGTDRTFRVVAE